MSIKNSGKWSERAVKQALDVFDVDGFDYQRMYDATSARGAFMAQTGDFQMFMDNAHAVIEVKSTQHAYRIAKGAFSELQRAKLDKRRRAGGYVFAVIHHHLDDHWRLIPFRVLNEAFNKGENSVDLTAYPVYASAQEVVNEVIGAMLNGNHDYK